LTKRVTKTRSNIHSCTFDVYHYYGLSSVYINIMDFTFIIYKELCIREEQSLCLLSRSNVRLFKNVQYVCMYVYVHIYIYTRRLWSLSIAYPTFGVQIFFYSLYCRGIAFAFNKIVGVIRNAFWSF